jgi:uncharacterized protein
MPQVPEIEIHTVKKVNLKGGTLIDGFPSGGLTNSIASTCFMRSIRNELIFRVRFIGISASIYDL